MMVEVFLSIIIFVFGLIVGSFLNCLIYRLEKKESFLGGRSYCPSCWHSLNWLDLIPVLSFLLLKAKCRYCQKPISWQYPLVEIATGLFFLLILNFQFSIFNLIIACFLIVIFVYDLKHFIIPDKVVFPAILVSGLYLFLRYDASYIYAAFGAALFFFLFVFLSRGKWMGIGDIKLAFLMGLFLGFPNILVALFLAFLIGAVVGIALITTKKKELKSEIPFGPFLVLGTFIALLWGERLVDWYLRFCLIQ